ncbi:hypothetical protein EV368DRAFT_87418 [Lentinula lateritia]|nr:hypothetical protein EV368DRAFT_87418 [Lentinula lateritia]
MLGFEEVLRWRREVPKRGRKFRDVTWEEEGSYGVMKSPGPASPSPSSSSVPVDYHLQPQPQLESKSHTSPFVVDNDPEFNIDNFVRELSLKSPQKKNKPRLRSAELPGPPSQNSPSPIKSSPPIDNFVREISLNSPERKKRPLLRLAKPSGPPSPIFPSPTINKPFSGLRSLRRSKTPPLPLVSPNALIEPLLTGSSGPSTPSSSPMPSLTPLLTSSFPPLSPPCPPGLQELIQSPSASKNLRNLVKLYTKGRTDPKYITWALTFAVTKLKVPEISMDYWKALVTEWVASEATHKGIKSLVYLLTLLDLGQKRNLEELAIHAEFLGKLRPFLEEAKIVMEKSLKK